MPLLGIRKKYIIVPIYKKGDKSGSSKYHAISLLLTQKYESIINQRVKICKIYVLRIGDDNLIMKHTELSLCFKKLIWDFHESWLSNCKPKNVWHLLWQEKCHQWWPLAYWNCKTGNSGPYIRFTRPHGPSSNLSWFLGDGS